MARGLDYEKGLERLRSILRQQVPSHLHEFYTLEARLLENLKDELCVPSATRRSERVQIVAMLNDLTTRSGLAVSFNDLCRGENAGDTAVQGEETGGVAHPECKTQVELEAPTGAVALDSLFYVNRGADSRLLKQLQRSGTFTIIHGAPQTGKTSLLFRGIDYAKKQDALVVFVSFQEEITSSLCNNIDSFLRSLAHQIAGKSVVVERTQIGHSTVDSMWENPFDPKVKMTRFVEGMLRDVDGGVILAMDEADILFKKQFYTDFLGLLRAWHNKRARDNLWKNLSIVITISTYPSLLIDDISQSPLNVGLVIRLEDFSEAQVLALNQRHGSPLRSAEISGAMELLGGHPCLIRQALYTLVEEDMKWSNLVAVANEKEGPFGQHLHDYLDLLYGDPSLEEAMRSVVVEGTCSDHKAFLRLSAAGLVRRSGRKVICRCGLYQRFFENWLR